MEIRSQKPVPAAADAVRANVETTPAKVNEEGKDLHADAKRADAKGTSDSKVASDGKASLGAAGAVKETDALVKSETRALLAGFLQRVETAGNKPITQGTSAAGLEAFTALRDLLGAKRADVQIPNGFELRREAIPGGGHDVVLSPEALHFFASLAPDASGEVNAANPLAQAIAEQAGIAFKTDDGTRQRPAELRAVMQKYGALVEKFFAKNTEQTSQQLLAGQPTVVVLALEKAMPKIVDALRATFKNLDTQLKGARPEQEIVIPGPLVVQAEAAFAPVLSALTETEKSVAAIKQDPVKFKALQAAMRMQRETGQLDGVSPEIASVVRQVAPHGGQASDVSMLTGDVDALIYWVMNQVAADATGELRDIMKEMKQSLAVKKEQREKLSRMKTEQAAVDTAMRSEYNQLMGSGLLHERTSFDDYKAWRPVQTAEDGRMQLPPVSAADIPAVLREGPPAAALSLGSTAEPEQVSFNLLTPEYAQMLGETYGVSAGDMQALRALYESDVAKPSKDGFIAWIEGKTPGSYSLALVAGAGSANQKKLDAVLAAVTSRGQIADAEATTKLGMDKSAAEAKASAAASAEAKKYLSAADILTMTPAERVSYFNNAIIADPKLAKALAQHGVKSFDGLVQLIHKVFQVSTSGDPSARKQVWNDLEEVLGALGGHSKALQFLGANTKREEVRDYIANVNLAANECPERANAVARLKTYYGLTGVEPKTNEDKVYASKNGEIKGDDMDGVLIDGWWYHNEAMPGYVTAWRDSIAEGGPWPTTDLTSSNNYSAILKACNDANLNAPSAPQASAAAVDAKPPASPSTELAKKWGTQRERDQERRDVEANKKAASETHASARLSDTDAALSTSGGVSVDASGKDANGMRWKTGSFASIGADIETAQGQLDSMGEQSELVQTRMQLYMDRRSKAMETLSNVLKKISETSGVIVGNMK